MSVDSKKKNLSAKDICNIIKECSNSGINRLSYSGLELYFGEKESKKVLDNFVPASYMTPGSLPGQMSLVDSSGDSTDDSQATEIEEQKNDQLLLDDPAAWEEKMLEDDNYATDENRRVK